MHVDCDFIPSRYHDARRIRRMLQRRVVGVIVLLAVMAVWFYTNQSRIARADAMMDDAEAQQLQVANVAAYKLQLLQQRSGLNDLQKMLNTLTGDRDLVLIISELSRRVPETIVLTKCDVTVPSIYRFGIETDPKDADKTVPIANKTLLQSAGLFGDESAATMVLEGIGAGDSAIIDFAADLDRSPLFFKVKFDVLEDVVFEQRPGKTFSLTCRLTRHRGQAS